MDSADLGRAIVASTTDPKLFGRHFLPIESWEPWQVALRAIFALPMSEDERALFGKCTGRAVNFAEPVREALFLVGRRAGKSRILALVATALAVFRDYGKYLAPGERAVVMVLAADRDQAQVIFQYVRALLTETPMLRKLIEKELADELILKNRVTIGIYTSSYRAVRGRTLAAALCDEICFWRDDTSRDPASAVLQALRPALSTIPGSLLLCASSVYARSGVAYETFARHWGREASNVLVWKASTLEMNPTFRREVIEAARDADPASAASEYDSEFRQDIAGFLSDADIELAIDRGIRSRPMSLQYLYHAAVDMSGGRGDSSALAICHVELGRVVVDRVEVVEAPHDPAVVVKRFAEILSMYALWIVTGDAYSGEWVPSAFAKESIRYNTSPMSKSEIFLETLVMFTTAIISLPDHPKLEGELRQLERRPRPTGKDSIQAPRGGHEDIANAAMLAAWVANRQGNGERNSYEDNVTQATVNYDPLTRDSQPIRRPIRHPELLPPNLRGLEAEDFSTAQTDYDIFR
jgi:hypothetical protein